MMASARAEVKTAANSWQSSSSEEERETSLSARYVMEPSSFSDPLAGTRHLERHIRRQLPFFFFVFLRNHRKHIRECGLSPCRRASDRVTTRDRRNIGDPGPIVIGFDYDCVVVKAAHEGIIDELSAFGC